MECAGASTTCATGATLHEAWTAIYRSVVTINDPTPPTTSGASGTLLAPGYVRGNATAAVAGAADGSGIKAVQVRVDGGRVVAQTPIDCDYTRAKPCPDVAAPVTVPVVTSNIGDGIHTVEIGVVDAGDNFTAAATRTITVDNDPPVPPTPTSPVFASTTGNQLAISWAEPGSQVSALAAAHVTVCGPHGCATTTQPAGLGTATVALNHGPGTYAVAVSLADAAGNHDPNRAARWSITRVATAQATNPPATTLPGTVPPLPSARLTLAAPNVARDRRSVTVRGTVAPAARGRVRITLRARIGARTRTLSKHAPIRSSHYAATLKLPSRRWRTATITARYAATAAHRATTATRTVRNR